MCGGRNFPPIWWDGGEFFSSVLRDRAQPTWTDTHRSKVVGRVFARCHRVETFSPNIWWNRPCFLLYCISTNVRVTLLNINKKKKNIKKSQFLIVGSKCVTVVLCVAAGLAVWWSASAKISIGDTRRKKKYILIIWSKYQKKGKINTFALKWFLASVGDQDGIRRKKIIFRKKEE